VDAYDELGARDRRLRPLRLVRDAGNRDLGLVDGDDNLDRGFRFSLGDLAFKPLHCHHRRGKLGRRRARTADHFTEFQTPPRVGEIGDENAAKRCRIIRRGCCRRIQHPCTHPGSGRVARKRIQKCKRVAHGGIDACQIRWRQLVLRTPDGQGGEGKSNHRHGSSHSLHVTFARGEDTAWTWG
jgi:hypothetical protein